MDIVCVLIYVALFDTGTQAVTISHVVSTTTRRAASNSLCSESKICCYHNKLIVCHNADRVTK